MSSYLIHFAVYALAMVGVIVTCMLIFKKTMLNQKFSKKNSGLCIENALNLSQRKTLYVVKAGDEKFLIASDLERTSFIAKLGVNGAAGETVGEAVNEIPHMQTSQMHIEETKTKAIDYSEVMASLTKGKKPVLKEMMRKLNEQAVK